MRTPAQRGRYGRWLIAAREGRGFDTAEKALGALAAASIRIGKSTYAEYESGAKTPSRNHLPLLEGFWGPVTEPVDDSGDLAAALRAQADAITALTAELRLARLQQIEESDQVLRAIGALGAGRALPGKPAAGGREAARATR